MATKVKIQNDLKGAILVGVALVGLVIGVPIWVGSKEQAKETQTYTKMPTYQKKAVDLQKHRIEMERGRLMQQLQILKQKRTEKWAEVEACESTGDGRGVLKLVRLGQEHSDIMDEIHELQRKIRNLD